MFTHVFHVEREPDAFARNDRLMMSDLFEALRDTRNILSDLKGSAMSETRRLRAHVNLLSAATTTIHCNSTDDSDALLHLANNVRDEAIEVWRRQKLLQQTVCTMID